MNKCSQCSCSWTAHYMSSGVWYCSICATSGHSYDPTASTCAMCGVGLPKNDMHCPDCIEINLAAYEAIRTARRVGAPRYGPSSWRDQTREEHIEHAYQHTLALSALTTSGLDNPSLEGHLAHAICRLAMARALENNTPRS